MGIEWEEVARLPALGSPVADAGSLRLIAASGLGGAVAEDAANIAAGEEELSARFQLLHRVARRLTGWTGQGTQLLRWVAAPYPEGERRERGLAAAVAAAGEAVVRQYRAFAGGPLRRLVSWLERHGAQRLGLGPSDTGALAGAMLEAADPPPPFPSLAAAARFLLDGGPPAAPAPGEAVGRIGDTLAEMGVLEGALMPVRLLLCRGQASRGRCSVQNGAAVAAVELSGRYADVVTLLHETGHALQFAHAGTKGTGTSGIAVAEGFAHLLGQLGRDLAWAGPWMAGLSGWARLSRLMPRRAAAANWRFALEAARDAGEDAPAALEGYARGQAEALSAPFSPGFWLAEPGTAHSWLVYLLSTCLSAALTADLRRRLGREWFRCREAGALLREWIAQGSRSPACFIAGWLREGVEIRAGL
ncbi:MAG: hypothetical protein K6T75_00100 [Acetobacteraceae bacterium]|nr:hypothetical protein [Acetobacteraceae bacterium]